MTLDRRPYRLATAALSGVAALAVAAISTQVFPHHSVNHDEAVYLQQAAMLLDGQLFLHPPVEGVFRPWFFVEDGDRLYPKYNPVPAAMFALGKLLGGYRVALVGVGAGLVALVVAVVEEVFDRRTGLVAGVFLVCSPFFLIQSSVFLPYAPTTLLNLAFACAYLRADRTGSRRWAGVAGAAVGLAFFARPYTAVLFAAPFLVHALWTLRVDRLDALPRQAITAALGSLGVAVTLAYNAVVTGSPWLFPYQAFAPLDGLGFGQRRILGHEVVYTPELALRANARVLDLLFTEWVAGGLLGTALVAVGLALVGRSRPSAREAALAGLFVTVTLGNVYFWGNFNVLGALEVRGDGLVAMLGPYYHFDLLVPTSAFAARGAVGVGSAIREAIDGRLEPRQVTVAVAVLAVVGAGAVGAVAAGDVSERIERNAAVTATFEDAYEPVSDGPPANALVLLPDPYGDWLNHPFQPLRNDPGFDGRAVYAIDDRPFATADAFPDRRLYRYVYRGAWAPDEGSPDHARLQRVRDVTGDVAHLETTLGVPDGVESVTARVSTDDGQRYYVASNVADSVSLDLRVTGGRVRVGSGLEPLENGTLSVAGRDTVRVTVFLDYGAGAGFSYRLDLPVDAAGGDVRALTPRIERCRNARTCGGAAAHIPESAPQGAFVRTTLTARERNP